MHCHSSYICANITFWYKRSRSQTDPHFSFLNPPNNMKIFALVTIFALAFLGANTSNAESLDRLAELMVRKVKIQPPSKCLFNVSELMMELSSVLEVLDSGDSRIQALEIKKVCEKTCNKNCGSVSKNLSLFSSKIQLAFLSVFLALHMHYKSP